MRRADYLNRIYGDPKIDKWWAEYQIEGVTEPNETIECCDAGLELIQQLYQDVLLPRRVIQ